MKQSETEVINWLPKLTKFNSLPFREVLFNRSRVQWNLLYNILDANGHRGDKKFL